MQEYITKPSGKGREIETEICLICAICAICGRKQEQNRQNTIDFDVKSNYFALNSKIFTKKFGSYNKKY